MSNKIFKKLKSQNNVFLEIFKNHKDLFEYIVDFLDVQELYPMRDSMGKSIIDPLMEKRIPEKYKHLPYASYRLVELGICARCFKQGIQKDLSHENYRTLGTIPTCSPCYHHKAFRERIKLNGRKVVVIDDRHSRWRGELNTYTYDIEMVLHNSVFLHDNVPTLENTFKNYELPPPKNELKLISDAMIINNNYKIFINRYPIEYGWQAAWIGKKLRIKIGHYYVNIACCLDSDSQPKISTEKAVMLGYSCNIFKILKKNSLHELDDKIEEVKRIAKNFNDTMKKLYKNKICEPNAYLGHSIKPSWTTTLHRLYQNNNIRHLNLRAKDTEYQFYEKVKNLYGFKTHEELLDDMIRNYQEIQE